MRKRVIILGSTGSVGRNTLDVLAGMQDQWDVVGLAAGSRVEELREQAARFHPEAIAVARPNGLPDELATLGCSPKVLTGDSALADLVEAVPCDCVVSAVVGAGGQVSWADPETGDALIFALTGGIFDSNLREQTMSCHTSRPRRSQW